MLLGYFCFYLVQGLLWSLSYDTYAIPITTKVASLNPADGEVSLIQHYVIKFVNDLWQVGGFLQLFRFPAPIKLTAKIQLDQYFNISASEIGPDNMGWPLMRWALLKGDYCLHKVKILKDYIDFSGTVMVVIIWQLDLQLPVQLVPMTTEVVSSNPAHGEVYSIQHYVIKIVGDLRQVCGFLHDITEILLKVVGENL